MNLFVTALGSLDDLLRVRNGQQLFGTVVGKDSADGSGEDVMATVSLPGSEQTGQFPLTTPEDLRQVSGLYSDIQDGIGDDSSHANVGDLVLGVVSGLIQPKSVEGE